MIQMIGVSASYGQGQKPVLNNLNISIEDGEFVLITGESGVGKSTFLKLLLRELKPTEGTLLVDEKEICLLTQKELPYYRRKFGMVFQDYRLIANQNAYENVKLARLAVGNVGKDTETNLCSLFSLLGITDLYKALPEEMSGGQKQKVCLARALANYPKYLLADEPTGNLDPKTSRDIMQLFALIQKQGTTVIVATHDKQYAEGLGYREIVLANTIKHKEEKHENSSIGTCL